MNVIYKPRDICQATFDEATDQGWSALAAKVIAGRVSEGPDALQSLCDGSLASLPDPHLLKGLGEACTRLSEAVKNQETIAIVTDYDVDGITSHAIIHSALTQYFALPEKYVLSFLGDRWRDGYGLRETLVKRIVESNPKPSVVITADCGSSDSDEIAMLAAQGIDVIITDHHLVPSSGMPKAAIAAINPQQEGCNYPDKTIAGCMVAWLLMSTLRSHLVVLGAIKPDTAKLSQLLDWVALGTVADAVSFQSAANRAVVKTGIKVMNQLRRPCWQVLASELYRRNQFEYEDLAFQIAPRINARGRLHSPDLALRFFLAGTVQEATQLLAVLNQDNQSRRDTERAMATIAIKQAAKQYEQGQKALVAFDESFHMGVQGIVASRMLERFGCPSLVLSPGRSDGMLSGSARSTAQVDIRALLEAIDERFPGVIARFGGHAGAAGLTLQASSREAFEKALAVTSQDFIVDADRVTELLTDGELEAQDWAPMHAEELAQLGPYGREFEAPIFSGRFELQDRKPLGKTGEHFRLTLLNSDGERDALWFRAERSVEAWSMGEEIDCAFELKTDGSMIVKHAQLIG